MRHDDKLRRYMRKHCEAEVLADYDSLPFLYLGPLYKEEEDKEELGTVTEEAKDLLATNDYEALLDVLPFREFVVADPIPNDPGLGEGAAVFYAGDDRIRLALIRSAGKTVVVFSAALKSFTRDGGYGLKAKYGYEVITFSDKFSVTCSDTDVERTMVDAKAAASGILVTLVNILAKLIRARDKHLVEVVVKDTKAKKKSGLARIKAAVQRNNLPHYVYLDAPTYVREGANASTGSGTPKKGHARRGTWVRLRHDRYKHHPKFGGKIWRKPTWVGPTEWTVGNTIYTLKDLRV